MRKVNLPVIKPWIVKKVIELLGFDDEVVVEYAMGLLEDPAHPVSRLLRFPTPSPYPSDRFQIQGRCRSISLAS
jgi:hypothetical protein